MDARALGLAVATFAGLLSCGDVREVIIADGSDDGSDDGSSEGTATIASAHSTGMATGGPTGRPWPEDRDTTTGPPTGDEVGSSGAPPAERVQVCDQPVAPISESGGEWLETAVEAPPGTIASGMRVALRIDHPRVADLRAELIAPDPRASASLLDTPPCEGARVQAVFDDTAERSVDERCQPGVSAALEGDLQPNQPLDAFEGVTTPGTWTLRIQDVETDNGGTLEGWCLDFEVLG